MIGVITLNNDTTAILTTITTIIINTPVIAIITVVPIPVLEKNLQNPEFLTIKQRNSITYSSHSIVGPYELQIPGPEVRCMLCYLALEEI